MTNRLRNSVNWLASALLLAGTAPAMAGMCGGGPEQKVSDEAVREENFYRTLFRETAYQGIPQYNRLLIECNRKRDSNGGTLRSALGQFGQSGFSTELTRSDLGWKIVRGNYNFYGTEVTGQKYVYLVRKVANNWEVILPYKAEVNDVVKGRVDFFMGTREVIDGDKGTIAGSSRSGPAWALYDTAQVSAIPGSAGQYQLRPGAQPIAQTLCSSSTFSSSVNKYDGQNGFNASKRDPENRHIDLGLIQYRYDSDDKPKDKVYAAVREGCRVRDDVDLYWVSAEALEAAKSTGQTLAVRARPRDWILDNFVRVGQEFWGRPANFKLRMWLRGHNDASFSADERSHFLEDDYLTVRFATKFMPYGGNQMYKSNPIQFNNFSTMTTDGTFMHEIGHAFGLDDEYGGGKNGDCLGKTYGAVHASLSDGALAHPTDYQMCDGYEAAIVTTVYQYIATSRYVSTQRECKDDGNCAQGEWCNAGVDFNKNRCQPKAAEGDSCPLAGGDHACESGFCKSGRCYTPASASLGEACFVNDACRSGNCHDPVGGNPGSCVCRQDSDCGGNALCKQGTLSLGVNHCVATQVPTCREGWAYEARDPLNKDRCRRTSTETAPLECKLLITDKKENWTGPHAMKGPDECRSTKGKDSKGVKCPAGFQYTVRDGADSCSRSSTDDETPTCPPNWKYNSQAGRDVCEAPD